MEKQKNQEEKGFWEEVGDIFIGLGKGLAWIGKKIGFVCIAVYKCIKQIIILCFWILMVCAGLILATGIFVYGVSRGVGLSESRAFQVYREKVLSDYFAKYDSDKVPLLQVIK